MGAKLSQNSIGVALSIWIYVYFLLVQLRITSEVKAVKF